MNVEVNNLVRAGASREFIITVLKKAYTIAKPKQRIDNLSVALVDEKTIKRINRKYRKHSRVTDVLSFDDPYEIVICWKQLAANARKNKTSQKNELALLLVHGLLHMLGYDHKDACEKEKMQKMETRALNLIK